MTGVVVTQPDVEHPTNFLDEPGVMWFTEVTHNGDLEVYQVIEEDAQSKPVRPAMYIFAAGTWSRAVAM